MRPERIGLHDTPKSVLQKMSEGDLGALTVCVIIINDGAKIDPDSALGGFGSIIYMDKCGIYGSRIWMLYKDVCEQDMIKTIACLRACQMGFISTKDLNHAIDNHGEGVDVESCLQQVKERLPAFGIQKEGIETIIRV